MWRRLPAWGVKTLLSELKELWRFRELLIILVRRDIAIRYKNTVFGFAWANFAVEK